MIRLDQNYGQYRSCDLTDESVSAPVQRLDKSWIFRRVAERLTNLVNGGIQVVIDIHKGVGPEALLQLLAGDDFAVLLEQNDEYLERLAAQLQLDPAFAHFTGVKIYLEGPKANDLSVLDRVLHRHT